MITRKKNIKEILKKSFSTIAYNQKSLYLQHLQRNNSRFPNSELADATICYINEYISLRDVKATRHTNITKDCNIQGGSLCNERCGYSAKD